MASLQQLPSITIPMQLEEITDNPAMIRECGIRQPWLYGQFDNTKYSLDSGVGSPWLQFKFGERSFRYSMADFIRSAIEALTVVLLLLFAGSTAQATVDTNEERTLAFYDNRAEFDRVLNGHLVIDFNTLPTGVLTEQLKVQRAIFKTDVMVENGALTGVDRIDLSKGHYNAFGGYFTAHNRDTFTVLIFALTGNPWIMGRDLPNNDPDGFNFYGFTVHGGFDWAEVRFTRTMTLDNIIVGRAHRPIPNGPEPSGLVLLISGTLALVGRRR